MQWHEVQRKLIAMQQVHQLCIHVKELTELGVYEYTAYFKCCTEFAFSLP